MITNHTRSVVEEVFAERVRQVDVEGFTPEGDDVMNHPGDLARAACVYALPHHLANIYVVSRGGPLWAALWPWQGDALKPKNRRRDLVRAAALLIAEIEQQDRYSEGRSDD